MKKIYLLAAVAAGLFATTGCNEDKDLFVSEGNVILSATFNSDIKVVSRAALEDELGASTLIWISNANGPVRIIEGVENIPTDGIKLVGGHYVAEAWAGDSLPADFEKKYYKGLTEFDITKGTTKVDIECKIANVLAEVSYDAAIDNALTDYTMTVGHRRGFLEFVGRDDRTGYFMMPSNDTDLTWTLNGTQADGSTFTKTGKVLNAQPATKYVLTVKYNPESEDLNGASIVVEVDESAVESEESVTVTAAPRIDGIGFDISQPVYAEQKNVGKKSVYITAACTLTNVLVESELLTDIIGGPDIDLMTADQLVIDDLNAADIYFELYERVAPNSNLKLSFDEEFTNALQGNNEFKITVTDANGKTRSAILAFNITDAKTAVEPLDENSGDIWATEVTLTGKVLKDGATDFGFDYCEHGTDDWTHVQGMTSRANAGDTYYAKITGLTPNTTYDYRATAADFVSTDIYSFTTCDIVQLPNAGFENWSMQGNVRRIFGAGEDMFWDSGNEGATTLGDQWNLTVPESNIKHSGNYSAKLESKKVVVKFAAGNIFIGKYLATDGTDGVLGWGRPFNSRPKALKGYVKYTPKAVDNANGGDLKKGDMDQGIIYIALLDASTTAYGGEKWPQVIKTKAAQRSLFDPAGANVIAYGEKVFTEATPGDGLIEFEIPLNYLREGKVSNILLTASASRYGDYFTGGAGSVMYLDDFELVY